MVSERNRIIELINYLESCNINVNIGKNKAHGNKGYFKVSGKSFRIDIAKNLPEDSILKTLAHEFAHYVHYKYDKTLKSLDFIFDDTNEITEELINITVSSISKKKIQPLFEKQNSLKKEIANLKSELEFICNDLNSLELKIKKSPLKYLLKHDRVKIFNGFNYKYYSIDCLNSNKETEIYLKLLSKKRALRSLNSKISRLNKYYNSPTELFARSFELYVTDKEKLSKMYPNVYRCYKNKLENFKIPLLTDFVNLQNK